MSSMTDDDLEGDDGICNVAVTVVSTGQTFITIGEDPPMEAIVLMNEEENCLVEAAADATHVLCRDVEGHLVEVDFILNEFRDVTIH